jgi:hypothetical protein
MSRHSWTDISSQARGGKALPKSPDALLVLQDAVTMQHRSEIIDFEITPPSAPASAPFGAKSASLDTAAVAALLREYGQHAAYAADSLSASYGLLEQPERTP